MLVASMSSLRYRLAHALDAFRTISNDVLVPWVTTRLSSSPIGLDLNYARCEKLTSVKNTEDFLPNQA